VFASKTDLKANKRDQLKPSFYLMKVMVLRGRRLQMQPKTNQKGHPNKEAISGTFFSRIFSVVGIPFGHQNLCKIESKTRAAKS